jgi:hypothetical protein
MAKPDEYAVANIDGVTSVNAMNYFLKKGNYKVCLDKYVNNPFESEDRVAGAQFIEMLKNSFTSIKGSELCQLQQEAPDGAKIRDLYFNIEGMLHAQSSDWTARNPSYSQENLKKQLRVSANENEFVQNVLLNYCENEGGEKRSFSREGTPLRVASERFFKEDDVGSNFNSKFDLLPFMSMFKEAKQSGHSLLIGSCFNRLNEVVTARRSSQKECGRHAMVINGVKWNENTQTCEVHIKNSHGAEASIKSDWYPSEQVLPTVYRMSYYQKQQALSPPAQPALENVRPMWGRPQPAQPAPKGDRLQQLQQQQKKLQDDMKKQGKTPFLFSK